MGDIESDAMVPPLSRHWERGGAEAVAGAHVLAPSLSLTGRGDGARGRWGVGMRRLLLMGSDLLAGRLVCPS